MVIRLLYVRLYEIWASQDAPEVTLVIQWQMLWKWLLWHQSHHGPTEHSRSRVPKNTRKWTIHTWKIDVIVLTFTAHLSADFHLYFSNKKCPLFTCFTLLVRHWRVKTEDAYLLKTLVMWLLRVMIMRTMMIMMAMMVKMAMITISISLDMYTIPGWISCVVGIIAFVLFLPGIFQVIIMLKQDHHHHHHHYQHHH